jgi:Flp pilus assembly protein TadG
LVIKDKFVKRLRAIQSRLRRVCTRWIAVRRGMPVPRRIGKPLAQLCRDDRGVVALEYAIVFPMFLAIMLGVFALGSTFVTQELMDSAARDAARMIRIGTFTGTASQYSTELTSRVCNDLTVSGYNWVSSCTSKIQIYVSATSSGTTAGSGFTTLSTATVANGLMTTSQSTVGPKYDVILQIGYNRPWVAAIFSGNSMLVSTLAFQTEPY